MILRLQLWLPKLLYWLTFASPIFAQNICVDSMSLNEMSPLVRAHNASWLLFFRTDTTVTTYYRIYTNRKECCEITSKRREKLFYEKRKYEISVFSKIDTLQVIEELLSLKGHQGISINRVRCYYSLYSKSENLSMKGFRTREMSIQVEALFLISQIFFANYERKKWGWQIYAPYPILQGASANGERLYATIDGPLVDKAYEAHEKWFKVVKKIGLETARKNKIHPFIYAKYLYWFPHSRPPQYAD